MLQSKALEDRAALQAATMMAAAARTAPKTRGIDNIRIAVVDGDDAATRQSLVTRMREIARTENRPSFERDAGCIAASPAIVLIGVVGNPAGLDCGFCGQPVCTALTEMKGVCSFNSMDLGIASGSAVAVAADLRIDNRIMFSVGRAAMDLNLLGPEVRQALGIPLSVTGKSPYFDRR
jgi:uncharacterized ferredoxin-like protein